MIKNICKNSKLASKKLARLSTEEKNNVLKNCATQILKNTDAIIQANKLDIDLAIQNGIKSSLIDRLKLDKVRIESIADGIMQIAKLNDPINEYISKKVLPNGLSVAKKRVAMGVIGVIYEARPNVTSDAFAMCFKASSAVILKGGKEALNSNKAIVKVLKDSIKNMGYDENFITLIEDTTRKSSLELMKMNDYVDLLIPRGGAGLIKAVVENSTIPVIQTGVGNCHIYVDSFADIQKAIKIIINAKAQRPSVCNAVESVLIHKDILDDFLPLLANELEKHSVSIKGDEMVCNIIKTATIADDNDWSEEYLDYILAIKCVKNIDEAINHIAQYSTGHSEAIITENYTNANYFTSLVDCAVVYVNASTRFTDGEQFGFGAEIGISTQKLHARGPMGLEEITSYKYIVLGDGQIRQ